MNEHTGTVTSPLWYDALTALFLGIALAFVLLAVVSLVVKWRELAAERRPKPLPRTTRREWYLDDETPIANQLFREYVAGVSR